MWDDVFQWHVWMGLNIALYCIHLSPLHILWITHAVHAKVIQASIRNMWPHKNRTLTGGDSFINNGPLGCPGAIRISKSGEFKHFIIWFTAITVIPLVILMCAQSCHNAVFQTVTGGERQVLMRQWDGETVDKTRAFGVGDRGSILPNKILNP